MSDANPRGWCPGALRPMRTGDGLLVRLRLTGGVVSTALARALAGCAHEFGNGALDLSARANLHLRGVSESSLDALTERLGSLGLLDADAEAEAVRNVVASPMAGWDPAALVDVRPLVRALEQRLATDPILRRLPPKFGVTVEDGGSFELAELASDIRFRAYRAKDDVRFAVALGGAQDAAELVGACAPDAAPEAAAALARAFLTLRGSGPEAPRRMAALIGRIGAGAVAAHAKLEPAPAPRPPDRPGRREPPLGFHSLGERGLFGAAAPFGRWMADDLSRLADLADRYGKGELRLTIWRAILLPGVSPESTRDLVAACAGLAIDPADPRLAVVACPGAPACSSATTPTRSDALELADAARRLAPGGVIVHVSGCAKGCARPAPAAVTLVAHNGLYDFVLKGSARDRPCRRELTAAQARDALDEMNMGSVL